MAKGLHLSQCSPSISWTWRQDRSFHCSSPEGKNAVPYDWSPDGSRILVDVRDTVGQVSVGYLGSATEWFAQADYILAGQTGEALHFPRRFQDCLHIGPWRECRSVDHASSRGQSGSAHLLSKGMKIIRDSTSKPAGPRMENPLPFRVPGMTFGQSGRWTLIRKPSEGQTYRTCELLGSCIPPIDTGTIPVFPFMLNENTVATFPGSKLGRQGICTCEDGG